MKAIAILGMILISLPLLADDDEILVESPSSLAAIQALQMYALDFQTDTGNPISKEVIGVYAILNDSEAEASVYSASTKSTSLKNSYHCHFHFDANNIIEETHCHREVENQSFIYEQVPRKYALSEFQVATIHALELLKKSIPLGLIVETKIWQNAQNIEFAFKWNDNAKLKNRYIMCHYHGGHIDCHSQSRPGLNEPIESVAP
jgi:hypothetical protein